MEDYRGNKARLRRSPTDVLQFNPNLTPSSNQEKIGGKMVRTVPISVPANAGNLVRVGPNTEDSFQLGNPLERYQSMVLPATANPDGMLDRSDMRKVAKKAVTKEVL